MTTALAERLTYPRTAGSAIVEEAEHIVRAEADRIEVEGEVVVGPASLAESEAQKRNLERIIHIGNVALRAADISFPEDLCDLSEVRDEYYAFVNSITPRSETEVAEPRAEARQSLYDMLAGAARGDAEARAGVDANAETIFAEYMLKSGSIMEVTAEMSDDGEMVQFGQTTSDRQKKTLEWYPNQSGPLRANTLTEGLNVRIIEHLWKRGLLRGKKALEISLVPRASVKELFNYGFFLDHMTMVARLTSINDAGKVKIQTGLFGGVDEESLPEYRRDESFEEEMARYEVAMRERFDDEAAGELLERLGAEGARFMTTTEKLGLVVLLPEEVDILDIAQLLDEIISAKLDKPVFFGLRSLYKQYCAGRKPTREDYEAQWRRCRKQQDNLKSIAKAVADETIQRRAEAHNELQAIRLLAEVAKKHTTRYVIEQPTVNARIVLGREAAIWAEEARLRREWGDLVGAELFTSKAEQKARPTSCPAGGSSGSSERASSGSPKRLDSENDDGSDNKSSGLFDGKNKSKKEEKSQKTEWMRCVRCPLCKRDGVDAKIEYYPTKKIITCQSCRGFKEYPR